MLPSGHSSRPVRYFGRPGARANGGCRRLVIEVLERREVLSISPLAAVGDPPPDAFEPNNAPGAASAIALNAGRTVVNGSISAPGPGDLADFLLTGVGAGQNLPGDWDFYHFRVDHAETLRLAVNTPEESTLDPVISLLSLQSGNPRLLATSDGALDLNPWIERDLQPGDYVVGVSGAQGTLGAYQLQIDQGIAPQVTRLTPSGTIGASPSALGLWFSETPLDPQSVTSADFRLVALDSSGAISADVSESLGTPHYDATVNRITIPVLSTLPDGRYQLIAGDSIRSTAGIALDGDGHDGAGGNFIGQFDVDTTAPRLIDGSFHLAGIAGADASGIRYRFAGELVHAFPASPGDLVTAQLDVDGDGKFDDGTATITLTDGQTPFTIDSAKVLPPLSGIKTIQIRFTDAVGNTSPPSSIDIDTNLPMVAAVVAQPDSNSIRITFTRDDLFDIDQASSYRIDAPVFEVVPVSGDPRSVDLKFGFLPDGIYHLTVLSGESGVHGNEQVGDLDGDFDGVAGGDFVAPVIVGRQPPSIGGMHLAGNDAASAANFTNAISPQMVVDLSDQFVGTSEPIVLRWGTSANGQFDDGQATVTLNQSGVMTPFPIQINAPLSEGAHDIQIEATNAAGLTSVWSHTIFVDRTGPGVRSTQVTIPKDSRGEPTGTVQIRISFTKEMDPATVENLTDYLLLAANDQHWFDFQSKSDQSAAIVSAVYSHRDPAVGLPPSVTITIDFTDLPAGDYALLVRGGAITDLAGNSLMGGELRVPFQYNPAPPQIVSVRPANVQAGQPTNVLVIQFNNEQLQTIGVEQVSNYRLMQIASSTAIPISSIHYDPFTNLAYLTTAAPLSPGNYQLSVLARSIPQGITGISSLTGVAFDGNGDGLPGGQADIAFDLSHPVSLDEILQADADSLAQFARQVVLDALAQRKSFSSPQFADTLLSRLEMDPASAINSQALADAINQQLIALINRELINIAIDGIANANDYLVVWGRDAQFLLSDPYDSANQHRRIGFDANGVEINEIAGATLVHTTLGGQTFSLAIVPLNALHRLASNHLATVSGEQVDPLLQYGLRMQGLADHNAVGVLIVHGGNASALAAPHVDLPPSATTVSLDLAQVAGMTGFDPQIALLNQHLVADLTALFGPLEQLKGSLLFGWFDPVDYQLSEATGQSAGAANGVAFQNVPGGFAAANGGVGVVIIPGSNGGPTPLDMSGLGTSFRGAFSFAAGGGIDFIPLQGSLGPGESLVAMLDFRSFGSIDGGGTIDPGLGSEGGITAAGGGLPIFQGAQTVFTASIRASMFGGSAGLLPLFSTTSTLLQADGAGGANLSALASHVGRQGIIAMLRQLRLNVLRSLRSVRGSGKTGEAADRLIADFNESDPADLDSFFDLEPKLEGFIQSLNGQGGGQFEYQLKVMRALHDAVTKMNADASPQRHGPIQLQGADHRATRSRMGHIVGSPKIASISITTPPAVAPRKQKQEAPESAADAALDDPAGEPTHADQS